MYRYNLGDIKFFIENLGQELINLQTQPLKIETKPDGSKVTNADYYSHSQIAKFLADHSPFSLISEEQDNPEFFPSNTVWVLDPIDGTSHFIRGKKDYAIMLALVDNYQPVFSLIYQPGTSYGYYAEMGKGSYRFFKGQSGELIQVDRETSSQDRIFQLSSVKNYSEEHRWFYQHQVTHYSLKGGIGLKMGAIAEGTAHYYLNFNLPLKAWDIYPSILLAEEAHAWVGNAEGGKLNFNNTGYALNKGICVAPDDHLIPLLQETARITS